MSGKWDFDFSFAANFNGAGNNPEASRPEAAPQMPAELAFDGSPNYISSLNEKQREAATHTRGPLIVLAGAGSGKTKMLTSRIAYLMDVQRIPAHQILAMTFTNKAAQEMKERVSRHLGQSLGTPEIGTFHSVCVRWLRREAARLPFTQPFVIYDDSDQLSLLKRVMEKLGIDDKSFNPKGIQGAINRAKCDAIESHELEPAQHDIFGRQVKRVYEQYQKDMIAANALDFGEIICLTYRLLRDNPDIRAKFQSRYLFIHVDEYQDTNRAQYLLLSILARKQHGGFENICVVGDEDQSIYKWRGADIRNILDFEQEYANAHVVKLEQNYRSTQTIIDAAAQVIKNNRERKEKTLWTENPKGLPIVRLQLANERAEAEAVVSEIKKLCVTDDRIYGDFSIFYRTHAQSRQFEDVLRREKIPYQIVGGLRFYDRKEVKDILAYLRVILNPADSVSVKRIINVPARGIGKTTIDKLEEFQLRLEQAGEGNVTLFAAIQRAVTEGGVLTGAALKKVTQFVTLVNLLMERQPKLLLSEMYHLILDETGYVRELKAEGTDEAMARIENMEELDTLFQEFEEGFFEALASRLGLAAAVDIPEEVQNEQRPKLLYHFIEQATLVNEVDRGGEPLSSTISLMTLHSSKGLEFPVVFLPGMEEGLFPSIRPWEDAGEEEIEEERRLCYVGMTRARERLYLTHVGERRLWGNVTFPEPARFFEEIPANFIEYKDLSRAAQTTRSFAPSSYFDDVAQVAPKGHKGNDNEWIGRKLRHPEYGTGTIIHLDGSVDDISPNTKVTIEFQGRNQRKFILRYIKDMLLNAF